MKFEDETRRYVARGFLNSEVSHDTGSMKSGIKVERSNNKAKSRPSTYEVYGDIEIRDCFKRIDLSYRGGTKTKKQMIQLINSMEKVKTMITILEESLSVLEAVVEHDPKHYKSAMEDCEDCLPSKEVKLVSKRSTKG